MKIQHVHTTGLSLSTNNCGIFSATFQDIRQHKMAGRILWFRVSFDLASEQSFVPRQLKLGV